MRVQEDRSLLLSLTNMTEEEIARKGVLPDGHERRRRAIIGTGSCFRVEALPPTAGMPPTLLFTCSVEFCYTFLYVLLVLPGLLCFPRLALHPSQMQLPLGSQKANLPKD